MTLAVEGLAERKFRNPYWTGVYKSFAHKVCSATVPHSHSKAVFATVYILI
jgi:hypothetical protein